jgi:hypothetical protein
MPDSSPLNQRGAIALPSTNPMSLCMKPGTSFATGLMLDPSLHAKSPRGITPGGAALAPGTARRARAELAPTMVRRRMRRCVLVFIGWSSHL